MNNKAPNFSKNEKRASSETLDITGFSALVPIIT
jgi:hypothetical protein